MNEVTHPGKPKGMTFSIFPQEIRGSLLLAFCLLLLLFLSLALFALQQAREVRRQTELMVENFRKGNLIFSQLGNFALELNVIAKGGMRTANLQEGARLAERLQHTKAEIDSYIAGHLQDASSPAERQAWEDLQKGVADYWNGLQGMVQLIQRGGKPGAFPLSDSRALMSQRRLRANRERLFPLFGTAAMGHQQDISAALGEFRARTLLLTVLTLLIGIGIMYFSLRDIQTKTGRIKKERDFSQALIEAIGDGVALFNAQGRVEFANRRFAEMLSYPPEEILRKAYPEIFHPEDLPQVELEGPSVARRPFTLEGQLIRADGTSFPALVTAAPRLSEAGISLGSVALFRDITGAKEAEQEILRRNRELASLNAITATMTQSLNLQETLGNAVDKVMEALDLDGCEIYLQQEEEDRLIQVACEGMNKGDFPQQSVPELELSRSKPMAWGGEPIILNRLQGEIHLALLSQGFLSFASIPIQSQGITLGVLNAASGRPEGFGSPEIELLRSSANQMGMFIENVRSFERERRRVEELSSLIQVAQAVNSSLDLEKVLNSIVGMAAKVMNAPAANLMLVDQGSGELQWSANVGFPPEWIEVGSLKVGQSISGLVISTKASLSILEMSQDPRFLYPEVAAKYGFHSFLGVPLALREKIIGGLYICTTEPHRFSEREVGLLSALANQAALAIENARLFRETGNLAAQNFRRYQEVSILHEVGAAMRSTIHFDQLLPIILTGVTFGGGLGFNRAILFLADERNEFLEGVLGMGPSSAEEASAIWSQLEEKGSSLLELSQSISGESLTRSPFNLFARSLKIPLAPQAGVIARTAIERKGFNVQDPASPEAKIYPEFEGRLGTSAFATVPLLAKDQVIGVIWVDNLYNGRPITDGDFRFLAALANQAGMAIEGARLYSRLEEAHRQLLQSHHQIVQMERLATLGEMSATLAHQIRNPLVSIGGFARRLSQMSPEDSPPRQYLEIIQREVQRLEEIVKDILSVFRGIRPQFIPGDLNQIVRECLTFYQDRIKGQGVNLRAHLERKLPLVPLDATQMQQALSNLLDNALEAMPEGGDLQVSTFNSPEAVHLEITDTGPGIPPGAMEAIFDPLFTTKAEGTGLGLTLTHRIISNHQGRIEVRNLPERGATFSISLPRRPETEQSLNQKEEVV